MTTREASFDHATEAEAWLANADDEYTRVPPIRENIRDAYQRAQVHATLALVEQQRIANEQARIANLIAYVAHSDGMPQGHKEWIEEELGL